MTAAIALQVVVGIVGLLTLWLKEYLAKDKTYAEKQKVRNIVVSGNASDVAVVVDQLLPVQGLQSSSPAGEPSAEDVERRIGKL